MVGTAGGYRGGEGARQPPGHRGGRHRPGDLRSADAAAGVAAVRMQSGFLLPRRGGEAVVGVGTKRGYAGAARSVS